MDTRVIGREGELGSIGDLFAQVGASPAALVISGEAGIGKTILWEAAVEAALHSRVQMLCCRCLESEASLAFGGLSDLVAPFFEEVSRALAPPRRHALAVTLMLSVPGDQPLSSRAIGLALMDVLRILQERGPVVIAVDDLQWLDPDSATALQFALRRLREERVGFLATVREAPEARVPFEIERLFPEERLRRISLRPLSLAALHHLLRERLGLELTRPQLVRLREATAGNPLHALELGRELMHVGARRQPREPLPVPVGLRTLLERRLERLPFQTRTVLLAVAALDRPTVEGVARTDEEPARVLDALELAIQESVIELEGSRIRFAHPLLASVCYESAPPWRRRAVHGLLATIVQSDEERARHRALAADGPDAAVADALDTAAVDAEKRGAVAAAELLDLAADLTPAEDAAERRRRRLQAAWEWHHAGDSDHAAKIMRRLLGEAPPGVERSDVLFQLAVCWHPQELPALLGCFEEALVEAAGDNRRAARILATRSGYRLSHDPRGALVDARLALEKAERIEPEPVPARLRRHDLLLPTAMLAWAIARLARVETYTLEVTPGLLERGMALEAQLGVASQFTYSSSPTAAHAHRLIFRDELDRARAILEPKAEELTSEALRGWAELHLLVLEWLSGRWQRALDHAAEALGLAEQVDDDLLLCKVLQNAARVEANLGRTDGARAKAERALEIALALSDKVTAIESLAVLGHLELAAGNLERAGNVLNELPGQLVSLGWHEPSSPVWPDTIETLAHNGELARARAYLEQYDERARRANRLSVACATRCHGVLAAVDGDHSTALASFDDALRELATLPYPFEHGRTLLTLGQVRRQARQRRAAREALEQALAVFERLEARLWAERARSELQRISGRRAGSQQLTETERRVAALAGQGVSNKEIAASLFMSVHTVEAHLTRVYRKLGISSRAALASRLTLEEGDAAKV